MKLKFMQISVLGILVSEYAILPGVLEGTTNNPYATWNHYDIRLYRIRPLILGTINYFAFIRFDITIENNKH